MEPTETPRKVHQGRNVKRFREMLGIKQEAPRRPARRRLVAEEDLAPRIKKTIEPALLDEVAKALKVPGEAIRNYCDKPAVKFVSARSETPPVHKAAVHHE